MCEDKKFDSVIFDVDGTLWDARKVICSSWQAAIKENTKLPVSFDFISLGKLFGKTMDVIFNTLYPEITKEELEKIIPILYEYEHSYLRKYRPVPYEGTEETLKYLKEKYPLYIVTNAQKGYVETLYEATGIGEYFSDHLCYGDTLKPKDFTMGEIVRKHNLASPVYIGDTQGDAEACMKAGIPMIYAAYGLGSVEKPCMSIASIRELKNVL